MKLLPPCYTGNRGTYPRQCSVQPCAVFSLVHVQPRVSSSQVQWVLPRCETLQQRVVTVAGQCSGLPSLLWLLR